MEDNLASVKDKEEVVPDRLTPMYSYLGLHRIWAFTSPTRVEIMSTGATLFIDASCIAYVYDQIREMQDGFIISISGMFDGKNLTYTLKYGDKESALNAIDQLQDLVRNFDKYRALYSPYTYQVAVAEENAVESEPLFTPVPDLSIWEKIKSIFKR